MPNFTATATSAEAPVPLKHHCEAPRSIIGAEVTLEGCRHLTLLAETQAGYANLCRLISASRLDQLPDAAAGDAPWPGKVAPLVTWDHLARYSRGLIALSGCRRGPAAEPLLRGQPQEARAALHRLLDIYEATAVYRACITPCRMTIAGAAGAGGPVATALR